MPAVLLIAGKDLRQRLRDRSAIVLGLIAPLLIAALMSFAFKGTESFHYSLGVVNDDHGAVASQLVKSLDSKASRTVLSVVALSSASVARTSVRDGHVAAALVIPAGFSTSLSAPHPESLAIVTSVNHQVEANVTRSIVGSFTAQVNADRLSVETALATGAPASSLTTLSAEAATLRIPLQSIERPIGADQLSAISYYSPAMAIFFLLFTISFASRSFFVDRAEGMIERMRAAPLGPAEILVGKALSVFVYGTLSLATVGVITSAAFGANWGSPLAACLLGLALVISVVCLTALVIGVARTQRQAEGFASLLVFGLALLGGNFIMISSSPPLMRTLALFTPNGEAMRGFSDLATIGGGLSAVARPIEAILLISVVTGGAALTLARRAVS
ncbi:MAG TPA: ABC transporter permease [Acidimicrobiales bacterium]